MKGERWIEEGIAKPEEPELEDLENFQPINIAKNEKPYSEENTSGVAGLSVVKSMWIIWAEILLVWTKGDGDKLEWMKALRFDRTGVTELFGCEHVLFFKKREKLPPKWFRDYQGCHHGFNKLEGLCWKPRCWYLLQRIEVGVPF